MALYDDNDGRQLDLDLTGDLDDVRQRYSTDGESPAASVAMPRGPGRPRLGVVGKEVTLLPRHWKWLGRQRGGASAALRRLVDQARRDDATGDRSRFAQDAVNRVLSTLAGDLAGFEEANRALYRGDRDRFGREIAGWPAGVRRYLDHWLGDAFAVDDPS